MKKHTYRMTAVACYLGNVVAAIVINLTPILFIPLKEQFSLSYQQLGFLVLINFITQVFCDFAFSGLIDRYGFRGFAVCAQLLAVFGFLLFAASPWLLPGNPYPGFLIGTVIFSGSGGLLEVLLSPIINSIPTEEKTTALSLSHSFYAWGQVAVVLFTTLLLAVLGKDLWQLIVVLWCFVPILDLILFCKAPFADPIPEEKRMKGKKLTAQPFFLIAFAAILFGGAAENIISQWSSAFMEKALNLPKAFGDIAGICMFAVMLGLGRMLHGKYGEKFRLDRLMLIGAFSSILCYAVIVLSSINAFSLIACAVCGLSVSLLWPGTLTLTAERFPLAGSFLFAILAAGGDIGSSLGPWIVSMVADHSQQLSAVQTFASALHITAEQLSLRLAVGVGIIFPIGAFVTLMILSRKLKKFQTDKTKEA